MYLNKQHMNQNSITQRNKTLIMKKYYFLFILAISLNGYSQIEKPINKGNVLIGGYLSGMISLNENNNITDEELEERNTYLLYMDPNIGYFVTDGLAAGISIPFQFQHESYNLYEIYNNSKDAIGDGFERLFLIGVSPYIKYYFKFGLLLKFSGVYALSHYSGNNSYEKYKQQFYFTSGIGYSFFINSKVSLETMLNYSFGLGKSNSESDFYRGRENDYSNNDIYLTIGFQIFR